MNKVATGFISPIRTEAFQKLQLNAGAFLINFDHTVYGDADELRTALATALQDKTKLLGATRGGGTFVATQEKREPDMDGKRYGYKGGVFVDSIEVQLTGTLVEIRPEIFAKILATGEMTKSGSKTTVRMHTAIQLSDYIPNLVWVGDMADGGAVMISIKNALNNNGMTLTFTDKGEGTIPFEFHAYQDSVEDYDIAPFEVIFLDGENDGMKISPSYSTVTVGDEVTLTANQTVTTWASDDTDIATVDGGTVTTLAAGTVTITATTGTNVGVATIRVLADDT